VKRTGALLVLALAAGILSGCRLFSRDFRISGTVTIAANLQAKAPRTNSVLFIVATNMGGVPIAVRRIVNPQFPVDFSLNEDDLLVPGSQPKDALLIQVQMNTHGNVGQPMPGDLSGACPDPVRSGERRVHVVIDRRV
jgi:hypothetical protein